ncbi:unnamed protein product [Musa hybrid cultivar]
MLIMELICKRKVHLRKVMVTPFISTHGKLTVTVIGVTLIEPIWLYVQ